MILLAFLLCNVSAIIYSNPKVTSPLNTTYYVGNEMIIAWEDKFYSSGVKPSHVNIDLIHPDKTNLPQSPYVVAQGKCNHFK
jgi:hypothetical protein